MAYSRTTWKDRVVQRPNTFNISNNPDGTVTLIPVTGTVTEPGTPINATNMNKIELGIVNTNGDLANNAKRSEQYQGDLLELLYQYSGLKDKVAVRYRTANTIDIAVFYNEKNAVVYTFQPDSDGWYRLRTATKRPMTLNMAKANKNQDTLGGTWVTSGPPFYYTTVVGSTFTGSFYGTGCFFVSRVANTGGIWEIVVDGVYKKTISVWGTATTSNIVQDLFTGLPEGQHTIVGTFKGDDPDHVPSGGAGTARGWFNYSATDGAIGYYYNNIQQDVGIVVLEDASRKEYAFSAKPSSYVGSTVWVPEHGILTVMRNIVAKIYFGDRLVTDLTTEHTDYRWYSNVRIMTEFDAYHPSAATSAMWHGRIDQTIDGKGVHIKGSFKFLQSTLLTIAHPAMLAMDKSYTKANIAIDSYGNRYDLPWTINDDSDVMLGVDPFCVACITDVTKLPVGETYDDRSRDCVTVIKLWNYTKTMRIGEANRGSVYVRLRTDEDRKVYYVSHLNHTALAGEVFDFGSTYFIGDIPEASKVLPG